jgi:hypothetical protein
VNPHTPRQLRILLNLQPTGPILGRILRQLAPPEYPATEPTTPDESTVEPTPPEKPDVDPAPPE